MTSLQGALPGRLTVGRPADVSWAGHIDTGLTPDGLDLSFHPSPPAEGGAR